ncbi:prepilin-type N-terminal cleavage/methylation domain-containing protein [Alsobacter sp. R-9]
MRLGAPRQGGFTILETLVALLLVALLAGAVLQAVRWVAAVTAFGDRADRAAALQAGANAVFDLLAGAIPAAAGAASFEGGPGAFSFDTVSDGTAMAPGRVRATLRLEDGRLVAEFRPLQPAGGLDPGRPPARTTLVEGVSGARVSYFGAPVAGGPAAWSQAWASRVTEPDLVLLELALSDFPSLPNLPLYARVGRSPATLPVRQGTGPEGRKAAVQLAERR